MNAAVVFLRLCALRVPSLLSSEIDSVFLSVNVGYSLGIEPRAEHCRYEKMKKIDELDTDVL